MKHLKSLLPSRPFIFLFLVYLLAMLFLTDLRLLFALHFHERLAEADIWQILTGFLIGLRFDQVVVLYILLPLILLLPWISLQSRVARRLTVAYLTIVFSLTFLLILTDIRYYSYFNSHLNFMAVDYLDEGPIVWKMIVGDSKFYLFIFLWLCLSLLLAVLSAVICRRTKVLPHRRSWSNQLIYFLLGAGLVFVGIRGRTSLSPMDWGVAYFSQNHFLNQLALNGVYTLGRAITEEHQDPRLSYLSEPERFPFVPFAEGLDTVQAMLEQEGDEWLEPSRSLLRLTRQAELQMGFRPNVVLVLMESWTALNTGALGSNRGLTPNFDRLASEGILFTNFYASGIRTNYGLPAVLCSFPSLPGRAVMKRYNALHPFRTLSEILHDRGYYNAFAYGSDLAFDNIQGFFTEKQYDCFYGDSYFGRENAFSKWGIPDHILFEKSVGLIDSLPRPFQLTILTISNHEPFDLPDSSVRRYMDASDSSRIFNSQVYADQALGRFIAQMRGTSVFDSTIFVFTADHARFGSGRYRGDPQDFHVPLLVYSPGILGTDGKRIEMFGSQIDIIPTLMGLLGGDYVHASWGRDLLKLPQDDPGFAPMNVFDRVACIDCDYFYFEVLGHSTALYETETLGQTSTDVKDDKQADFLRLQRRLRIFVQIAEQLSTPTPAKR
ncbi:MAG: sulfatase-like hydrolase/transferase [Desulfobacteraceae bacterium]|nr:sulfatase-like hydrolase/transferase [Desulfobacteraceae bacterium]